MEQPIYQQIIDSLRNEIKNTPANTAILSERELSEKYHASRMTVRKAVRKLVEQGLLYRDGNRGTFVSDQRLHKHAPTLQSSSDHMKEHRVLYFDLKSDNQDIEEKLELRKQDQFIRIVKLNQEDKVAESVDEIYIVRAMIDESELSNINRLMDMSGIIESGSIKQAYIPTTVPVQYASFLHLKLNTPIIAVESTIYTKNARIYAFIRSFINPELKRIEITF